MTFNIKTIAVFEKQTKRLLKKYPSLKSELIQLVQELKENPEQGNRIGKNCYKIRISIASKGKGKSGGARIITHIVISKDTVYLLSIYDKSDQETLSQKELDELLKYISDDL
ncbi:MAG TPA: type II toxin-antitoxin system RelE/ParE family toxin [Flavobacterium alvei]|nr:type II toxin-antitoxin system RelE/ParE family toxin [Flavobacterium alvei]HQF48653.1 type II toxin-antitoxin system RelE/ParE family toxin [Flavobacterium alvei]HQK40309.1 type II toxin-antitoxin system RelE/ParE family toxin [Flavobacterium alvei]